MWRAQRPVAVMRARTILLYSSCKLLQTFGAVSAPVGGSVLGCSSAQGGWVFRSRQSRSWRASARGRHRRMPASAQGGHPRRAGIRTWRVTLSCAAAGAPRVHAAAAAFDRACAFAATGTPTAEEDDNLYCSVGVLRPALREQEAVEKVQQPCERCKQQKGCQVGLRSTIRARKKAWLARGV